MIYVVTICMVAGGIARFGVSTEYVALGRPDSKLYIAGWLAQTLAMHEFCWQYISYIFI